MIEHGEQRLKTSRWKEIHDVYLLVSRVLQRIQDQAVLLLAMGFQQLSQMLLQIDDVRLILVGRLHLSVFVVRIILIENIKDGFPSNTIEIVLKQHRWCHRFLIEPNHAGTRNRGQRCMTKILNFEHLRERERETDGRTTTIDLRTTRTLDGKAKRSPLGNVSSLLSSKTELRFSTHSGSTSPSKMIHCRLVNSPRTLSMIFRRM